ncbi:malto-oligosyltrehalose trehalohydrolase [Terriglobus tenax]|uniref:malto-oligosyltrehalose trehalohydrolase n=1 Tax=Terriglobus tenax TaxID=1111115 RepID=UPI0021E02C9F|nr:malto-oligosyltrehalose trehalohydrolase [Terriglobus tenax]
MHRFKVWAPRASRVRVQVNKGLREMNPPAGVDDHGWWHLEAEDAGPGTRYGFAVDDDDQAWPDPRSLWQPDGVHGLSCVYDQRAFQWTDKSFQARPLSSGVIYELHPGTFTQEGTLYAAIARLDFLVELGITHVELLPVAAFPGHFGWGYDGVALYAVHEPYGGPDALKRFVDAAHGKGLAVLLDVVYNHFGPVGNYTGKYGPYLTETHHTPWGGAVNFEDWGSDQVRRFFIDNALMWMRDFHMDGLRLDAVHAFVDRSAIHFLEQLSAEVEHLGASTGRQLVLIAESDLNDPRVVTPREAGGLGIDAQWSDDFHHALFTAVAPQETKGYYEDFGGLAKLAKSLEKTFVYDGVYSKHRNRTHGRPVGALDQHRFLGYIQNHDQIGNRAQGDRVSSIAGLERAKAAAALVLLGPFVPMLFQGEEWAASTPFLYFAEHEDPAMAKAVRNGRRREFAGFGWKPKDVPDPVDRATFERSRLQWDELEKPDHAAMLDWYRSLIALRHAVPELQDGAPGNCRVEFDEQKGWLVMHRGPISVAVNLGKESVQIPVQPFTEVVLPGGNGAAPERTLTLEAGGSAVLRRH